MKIDLKFLVIGLVVLMSCSNENEIVNIPIDSYENKVTQNVIATAPSVYSNFFVDNSPMIGFSSLKDDPISDHLLTAVVPEEETQLKSEKYCFSFEANGVDLIATKNSLKSGQLESESLFKTLYGKNVLFSFRKEGELKSGELVETDTVTMYIPNLVQITSPKIETQAELFPKCYYEGFKLGWQADVNNKNGLVVIVEWNGTVLSEGADTKEYIRNIDVVSEDSGETILNNKLFDNIPDKALTYITLLRGNISIAEIDGQSYRIFGESHAVLPFILIRNL